MNSKVAHAPFAELLASVLMTSRRQEPQINYGLLRSYCVNRKEFKDAVELADYLGVRVRGLSNQERAELQRL